MGKGKVSWSYSSLNLFKQCPHKYYRLRIAKDIVDPPQKHLQFGLEVHKAAEDFVKGVAPLPQQYALVLEPLKRLRNMDGEKLCEYQMGLTRGLEPCGFMDPDVWWRGVADLVVLRGSTAYLVDYKTSKSARYADTKQLEVLSLALFKHFPKLRKIKAGLLFVVAHDFVTTEYAWDTAPGLWMKWMDDVSRLEKSVELDVWNPRPNFTCGKWCSVSDCVHNGNKGYW